MPESVPYVDVEAKVLSVKVLETGGYGHLLGPPPELYYVVADEPLRVGAKVSARGPVVGIRSLPGDATLTQIACEELRPVGDVTERYVHEEWLERVDLVCRRPLYDYQREGAAWIASRLARGRGSIIADDMGLGKSQQIVAAALAAQTFPMIVVCPFTLKKEWRNELQQSTAPLSIEELESANRDFIHPAQVYLVHYDILKLRRRQLRHLDAKLVVFDEGHLLKEPRPHATHRAAVATDLAHRVGLAVIATGTPLLNNAAEYWRLLHIVDPKSWPSYDEYAERYTHLPTEDELREDPAAQKRIVTSFGRVERSEELQSRVEQVLIRRTKAEARLELPPKERRVLSVELDAQDRREYERARQDLATWYLGHGQDLRASRAVRTEALMKLSVLRQIAAMAKMRRAVPEYLGGWFGREVVEPIVVFGYHRAPLAELANLAVQMKIRAGAILGSDGSEASRAAVVDAFRAGEIDMLIAPIRVAGIGLNLQNAARAMFLEWTWVPADMEQAEARIDRIGQSRRTVIDYLAARGTIDDHMAQVIAGKQVLIDQLVDGEIRHESATKVAQSAAELGAGIDEEKTVL